MKAFYCQFHITGDISQAKRDENSLIFDGKKYSFLGLEDYKEGDVVIVECQHGLKVARVMGECPTISTAHRYIIGLVDLDRFYIIRDTEQKRRDLEAAIDERLKIAERAQLIARMADIDFTIKALVEELNSLNQKAIA